MKKFVVIFVIFILILSSLSIVTMMYKKNKIKDIPSRLNEKLEEAHKSIVLFNYKRADELYRSALASTDDSKVLEEYLAFLVTQEDLKNALKIAEKILVYNPNHFLANLIKTAYLIKSNRVVNAIQHLQGPAQDTSSFNNAIFAVLSSLNYFIKKQNHQFEEISSQIKNQIPDFYYHQLMLYYVLVKDQKGAYETAKLLLKEYPNMSNILLASKIAYLHNKAEGMQLFRQYLDSPFLTDEAIKYYLDAYSINTIDIPVVFSSALYRLSQYMSSELTSAYIKPDNILLLHVALMVSSSNYLARIQTASYYMQLGDYATALKNFNYLNKGRFAYRLLYPEICKVLVEFGEYKTAIKILTTVYNEEPTNPEPLIELGHLYYKLSIKKDNSNNQDMRDKVIKYYSKALKISKDYNLPLGQWLAYYFRGIAYNNYDNWYYAEQDLLQALNLNNKDPLLLNYLGYSWVDRDINIDKGLEYIQTALKMEPQNPNFLDSYGWGLFKKGNYKEALKVTLTAFNMLPLDYSINAHLGDIYWQMGEVKLATQYWTAALNMEPDIRTKYSIVNKLSDANKLNKPSTS